MSNPVDLLNTLKDKRKSLGLTQAELAKQIQVSRKTINTIENRIFVPSTILALKLAQVLEVSVEDLFQLETEFGDWNTTSVFFTFVFFALILT